MRASTLFYVGSYRLGLASSLSTFREFRILRLEDFTAGLIHHPPRFCLCTFAKYYGLFRPLYSSFKRRRMVQYTDGIHYKQHFKSLCVEIRCIRGLCP